MTHPLAIAAAQIHPQSDVITSAQGIGERLDVQLARVDELTLNETRALAAEIDQAHTATGRGLAAYGWHRAAIAQLAARERALLTPSEEAWIAVDATTLVR